VSVARSIEAALARHPAVRRAAVTAAPGEGLLACVEVASGEVAPGDPGEVAPGDAARVGAWRALWEDTYASAEPPADPSLDLAGWVSSYTGMPIPPRDMREWVEGTVERVLALRPRRVLEIGCGTGMLLLRIAPHCAEVHAIDFSPSALASLERRVAAAGLANVRLSEGEAHELPAGGEPFDLVILNSVVQYFAGTDFLRRVLAAALERTAPVGAVFVGDVRNRSLLTAFHASVELQQADPDLPIDELASRVEQRLAAERELLVDPAFFTALDAALPRRVGAEIQLKRGRRRNELTRFRYDVVLHADRPRPPRPRDWLDWNAAGLTVGALAAHLAAEEPAALGLRGVPNARLAAEVAAVEALRSGGSGAATAGELRRSLRRQERPAAVDPEELWSLAERLPYGVEVRWGANAGDGTCDVLLRHREKAAEDVTGEPQPVVPTLEAQLRRQLPPDAPPVRLVIRAAPD
jgi:SAM-dependent methyltransferase